MYLSTKVILFATHTEQNHIFCKEDKLCKGIITWTDLVVSAVLGGKCSIQKDCTAPAAQMRKHWHSPRHTITIPVARSEVCKKSTINHIICSANSEYIKDGTIFSVTVGQVLEGIQEANRIKTSVDSIICSQASVPNGLSCWESWRFPKFFLKGLSGFPSQRHWCFGKN